MKLGLWVTPHAHETVVEMGINWLNTIKQQSKLLQLTRDKEVEELELLTYRQFMHKLLQVQYINTDFCSYIILHSLGIYKYYCKCKLPSVL